MSDRGSTAWGDETLADWAERGWLRRLDAALARFAAERWPAADAPFRLAIALLAHLEGRGHACLPLADWVATPAALAGWAGEAAAALAAAVAGGPADAAGWAALLRASPLVDGGERGDAADSVAVPVADPEAAGASPADRPFVLRAQRLYLRRYWDLETQVAAAVDERTAAAPGAGDVDPAAVAAWLDRLFPAPAAAAGAAPATPDWQRLACAIALRGRLTVITGGPGTGKTWTAARLLALRFATAPDPLALRVALAAPTGKAAARLQAAIADALAQLAPRLQAALPAPALAALQAQVAPGHTLHRLLGARPETRRFAFHRGAPLPLDLLIVDEASMVHLEMMAALLEALPPQAQLVLLGDKDQLASVEAGAVLGDLCRGAEAGRYRPGTARALQALGAGVLPPAFCDAEGPPLAQHRVMLRESRRFGGAIGALARAVNGGDAAAAEALLRAAAAPADAGGMPLHWLADARAAALPALARDGRAGAAGGYRDYLALLSARPPGADEVPRDAWILRLLAAFDRFRVLCAVREGDWGVAGLNAAIEADLARAGLLAVRGPWYEGRPVIVTRNDRGLGVANGDIGLALRPRPGEAALRVYFADGQRLRSAPVGRLADVETAFAMTVHKAQGSEFAHTVLVLPGDAGQATTRELIYTGITRAREAFTLVSARPQALADGIGRVTRRASGLAARLAGGAP